MDVAGYWEKLLRKSYKILLLMLRFILLMGEGRVCMGCYSRQKAGRYEAAHILSKKKGSLYKRLLKPFRRTALYRILKNRCLLFMKDLRAREIFSSIFLRCAIHFPVCA